MKRFTYTSNATADLRSIVSLTLGTWGEAQAVRYIEQIEDCCERLAENARIGRLWRRKGHVLRRMEQGSHVIFYREQPDGILVLRILHKRMLPGRQSFDEG